MRKFFAFMVLAASISVADILPFLKQLGDDEIGIDADNFEVDNKTGWVTGRGNVRVKMGDRELLADKVRLNRGTGDVRASGNVKIQQNGLGGWAGNYIEYNYKTGKGMTGMGQIDTEFFHVHANEVTRREDGLFDLRDLRFTTCTNSPERWHWCMRGNGHFKDNDYIDVYNVVPYFLGVPFAWLPYWYRDLDTHYGFRMMPGYTSKWGAYLLTGYVFPIYDSPNDAGPNLYGTTHLDFRTKRGVAAGQNVHWDLKRWGKGRFESYYAWDEDPPDRRRDRNWMSDINDERYRLRLFHSADFTERDQFLLRGTLVSDSEMRSDFFDRENRGESIPMNFASWEHRENFWAGGVVASGPLNNFYAGTTRLPEGWLNIAPQPLWYGINYESQTRAGFLDRQEARYGRAVREEFKFYPGSWADYDTVRVDTAHRFTYPVKIRDTVSLVPRAGYRGTYYSDSGGESDIYRHTGDFGVEASMRAVSGWDNNLRHTFEPYVDWAWQPTHVTLEHGKVYGFDRFDQSVGWLDQFGYDGVLLPYNWHGLRPGFRNLLQTRDEKGRIRSLLDWDAFAAVQFHSDGPLDEEGLRMFGSKLRYSPGEDIDFSAHGQWDTEADTVAYADLSAIYKFSETFRAGGGFLSRDHRLYDYDESPVPQWNRSRMEAAYVGFTHEINDTWSYSSYIRWDMRENELDEVGGYIQYQLDCLAFQLRTAYINDFTRIDGSERKDDFRISLMVWLRAHDKQPSDQWLRW
ncbi:MAG: LPS-assembly protein LptD [Kiritimatiellae bacterium]|nr:LPS-assembly protein LptD [Kiritimatiellia bacterium]